MKPTITLIALGLVVLVTNGCQFRAGSPSGSSDNPAVGAVAGMLGLADAAESRKKSEQKAKQESVNEYLDKTSKK